MKKTLIALAVSGLGCGLLISCGGGGSSSGKPPSGLTFRAFVSNPLHVGPSGGIFPALQIVDATTDLESPAGVSLSSALPDAGMMVLTPDKKRTLVVSPSSGRIAVVDNGTEAVATSISLPGNTQSLFVGTDNTSAFVAIPTAPIQGQAPGVVGRFNILTAAVTAIIPVPGAHYLVPSPTGNQILVFSDNSDSVTLIFPALLTSGVQPNTQVPCSGVPVAACTVSGFDRPVWGVFSGDGTTAYIFNCGLECGGSSTASIVPLSVGTLVAGTPIQVGGATTGMLSGNLLYVAGTPSTPSVACGTGTAAATCGVLSVIDTTSLTVTTAVLIPDGYHNRMQMGANGQLFIGSQTCTNVTSSSETRGCLAIYDTVRSAVVVPPMNGDVTGIAPIPNRSVVYVCQGGGMQIYDTRTDLLQILQVNIVGQPIDVLVVDF